MGGFPETYIDPGGVCSRAVNKIYKMSASPQQHTNEWCRISQLWTWISTIQLVEKYKTAN